MTASPPAAWGLVVPLKALGAGKSRLAPLGPEARERLALAFAQDVVLAGLACRTVERVVVVTDDPRAGAALAGLGAAVLRDAPSAGLNAAIEHGEHVLRAGRPSVAVAAVAGDLPALTAADLDDLLGQVGTRAFVADADGTGTTVLAATGGRRLRPRYGPGSRAAHLASGAVLLPGTPGLRVDVDTPADLDVALALGVGPHTRGALAALHGGAAAVPRTRSTSEETMCP